MDKRATGEEILFLMDGCALEPKNERPDGAMLLNSRGSDDFMCKESSGFGISNVFGGNDLRVKVVDNTVDALMSRV